MPESERLRQDPASEDPIVSVIVPVWNGEATIGRCLHSLHRQTFPSDRMQIIVVDNGSTDATLDIVRGYGGVLLLIEPHPSSYRARNRGLDHAKGEFVAFTDADCEADARWIEAGVATLQQHKDVGIAAGHIRMDPGPDRPESKAAVLYEQLFAFRQEKSAQIGQSVTANWMSPRWVFQDIGNFDASLKSGGDMHLSEKIVQAGLSVRYVPDMLVSHPTRGSIKELVSKRRRIVGGLWGRIGPERGVLGLTYLIAIELVRRIVETLSAGGYSLIDKMRVSVLLSWLAAVGLFELLRLQFGGEARRS